MSVDSWPTPRECGKLAYSSWVWKAGILLVSVECCPTRRECGKLTYSSWVWKDGLILVSVDSWPTPRECGRMAYSSWVWKAGLLLVSVEGWSTPRECGRLIYFSWVWKAGLLVVSVEDSKFYLRSTQIKDYQWKHRHLMCSEDDGFMKLVFGAYTESTPYFGVWVGLSGYRVFPCKATGLLLDFYFSSEP